MNALHDSEPHTYFNNTMRRVSTNDPGSQAVEVDAGGDAQVVAVTSVPHREATSRFDVPIDERAHEPAPDIQHVELHVPCRRELVMDRGRWIERVRDVGEQTVDARQPVGHVGRIGLRDDERRQRRCRPTDHIGVDVDRRRHVDPIRWLQRGVEVQQLERALRALQRRGIIGDADLNRALVLRRGRHVVVHRRARRHDLQSKWRWRAGVRELEKRLTGARDRGERDRRWTQRNHDVRTHRGAAAEPFVDRAIAADALRVDVDTIEHVSGTRRARAESQ